MASIVPKLTGPRGSYALIGLGTFLCGVTHAPLTALFLLLDMTQDYQIALPAMIAIVTALVVARALEHESIDTYRLAREGKTLEIGRERLVLTQIPVESVMTHDPRSCAPTLRSRKSCARRATPRKPRCRWSMTRADWSALS